MTDLEESDSVMKIKLELYISLISKKRSWYVRICIFNGLSLSLFSASQQVRTFALSSLVLDLKSEVNKKPLSIFYPNLSSFNLICVCNVFPSIDNTSSVI
jgi:hypothetical protein